MALSPNFLSLRHFSPSSDPNQLRRLQNPNPSFTNLKTLRIRSAKRSARTGKQRYPSEKKKLEKIRAKTPSDVINREEGFWRLSKLSVAVDKDPGKDDLSVSNGLLEAVAKVIEFPVATLLPKEAFTIVRKSFDARKLLKEPKFVYTVDMDVKKLLSLEPRAWDFIYRLEPKVGVVEYMPYGRVSADLISIIDDSRRTSTSVKSERGQNIHSNNPSKFQIPKKPKVAVVGSGPSGLFASLVLGELGAEVTLIERGQAVEQRGRDIGALMGGAGTWSDGKLVTRIGRNSDSVQAVLKTLVHFGAPPNILVDGKPHLGTDRLVPLLRIFRQHLQKLGVKIMFGTRLDDLLVEDGRVKGVKVSDVKHKMAVNNELVYDAVVLAVGHSARDVYQMLLQHDVHLAPKDFSVGLRIEHPQELINNIQYSALASEVRDGRGKVPVADYKVVKFVGEDNIGADASSGETSRSCYSFCMCPGGQVVLTSTNPAELCINGMSFSRRASRWANAALVVTVSSKDFESMQYHGPLAGIEFQREFEQRAANLGGGNFVVPVQSVTDFLEDRLSERPLPQSSYRLGIKAADLHNLYPAHITQALQHSITMFDQELPGFISENALLHGVETRTSSPLQITRNSENYESISLKGLYPIGEGAGYAGGIISAAVDGLYAGFAVAKDLNLYEGSIESVLGKAQKNTGFVKY